MILQYFLNTVVLHNFQENKRHPKLTQKATTAMLKLDINILSCRQVLPLHSGKQQVFSILLIKELLTVQKLMSASAVFYLPSATSLDSALLCSVTLVNMHTSREQSYFQAHCIPVRPISNCKERIR